MNAEDQLISAWESRKYVPKPGEPALPPQLSELAQKSTKDIMDEINRLPFFMNELDESDGQGGENVGLEALKSLAYDGEPDEVATNFKNQGNDCFKTKQYKDAIEFYTKGLDMDCGVDEINVALYVNRAACNLELKNYRKCIKDCKKALIIDESNVKACYRAGKAFFLVERYDEGSQILQYGLSKDPENKAIKDTLSALTKKVALIEETKRKKEQAEYDAKLKETLLVNAVGLRHFHIIKSSRPAEFLENASLRLEDPTDYESQLLFPAMVLYPTIDEFDFIAEISELSTANDILAIVLDRPQSWFEDPRHKNFTLKTLECYMETISGGLVKVGKKAAINGALMVDQAKAPLFDNALRLYVVPKQESAEWLKTWSKEDALKKRMV
ncbi:hypothetical protein HF325_000883 [Metschnikowia pulcherrima]|uniref:Cns1/TTC4 wheel domain-containing protein n=1 Tax=Metschnikowia pulcherrima TaxID=27326 RepID=A0A8H7LCU8_9ASCO|nr:hypothetical protein HF325_000883 [Metschnikowia pulcherrima]